MFLFLHFSLRHCNIFYLVLHITKRPYLDEKMDVIINVRNFTIHSHFTVSVLNKVKETCQSQI